MNKMVHKNCKFGNVCENLICSNSVKRHICHVYNSRKEHFLPTSVNDRVISPFRKGFIFVSLAKISEFIILYL